MLELQRQKQAQEKNMGSNFGIIFLLYFKNRWEGAVLLDGLVLFLAVSMLFKEQTHQEGFASAVLSASLLLPFNSICYLARKSPTSCNSVLYYYNELTIRLVLFM